MNEFSRTTIQNKSFRAYQLFFSLSKTAAVTENGGIINGAVVAADSSSFFSLLI